MSCSPRHRRPIGPAAIIAVLLTLLAATGCGRKGDPLPPLREPDPIAETAPNEAEAADSESSASEAEDGDDDDDGTPP